MAARHVIDTATAVGLAIAAYTVATRPSMQHAAPEPEPMSRRESSAGAAAGAAAAKRAVGDAEVGVPTARSRPRSTFLLLLPRA